VKEERNNIKYPITRKEHRAGVKEMKSEKNCFVILKSPSLFFRCQGEEERKEKVF
jgi:hypothetical protein